MPMITFISPLQLHSLLGGFGVLIGDARASPAAEATTQLKIKLNNNVVLINNNNSININKSFLKKETCYLY